MGIASSCHLGPRLGNNETPEIQGEFSSEPEDYSFGSEDLEEEITYGRYRINTINFL